MEEEKITYAQQFLRELLSQRKLRSWSIQMEVPHASMFKIANGVMVPTYAIMCRLLPVIAPANWFFYVGEKISYKTKTLEPWNPAIPPKFIRCHKHNWKEVGERYALTESYARNLFLNHRAWPSYQFIKATCNDVNPDDFFVEGDLEDDGRFYPERGDIVSIQRKTAIVLSTAERNQKMSSVTVFEMKDGKTDFNTLSTIRYVRAVPALVGKAEGAVIQTAMEKARELLE